jgi:prolipoprotein diacylglyceryltransferase
MMHLDPHGHDYYTPFYLLATFTNVLLLLVEGWRRGFSLRPWLTLVAAGSLALILGSKLITYPISDWATLLFRNTPTDTARSVLGGGLAATLTVLALRRWLGLSWAVLDALALPLCGALAVQCVGCVLTGCCFGTPTTEAWGLTYAAGTLPWAAQVCAGLLPAAAAHSLPVAPTQLMALLLCAAVGGVLLATRHRRWPVGSWLLLQTGLLLLGRFGQAFWRDPMGEPVGGTVQPSLGVNWLALQLGLLPLGLLALGAWAWRVHRASTVQASVPSATAVGPVRTLTVVVAMLVFTAFLGRYALTLPEMLVVRALLLTVLVAEAAAVLAARHLQGPRLVGVPLALAGLVLLHTAQTPAPSTRPGVPDIGFRRTTTLTGGALGSQHDADQSILQNNSGCSSSQRLALQQRVRGGGGEAAVETTWASGNSSTWGGGLWVGQQRIDAQPLPDPNGYQPITDRDTTFHHLLFDLHVYREIHRENDWLTTDVRLGLHIGDLGTFSYFGGGESRHSTLLMPELMVRVGKPAVLFGQADFCYGAENALGAYTTRLGLGSGLGFSKGPRVLAGYAYSPHHPTPSMGFASALLRLPGRSGFSLEPYYATDLGRHNNFSLKLNYRIGN